MGYKSNRGKGAIANARVNKLPRKQASWNNPSKSSKDPCRLGGLAQLSRTQAKKDK